MAPKLRSYLPKEIGWRLPRRALLGVIALLLALLFRFSFWGGAVYFALVGYIYFSEPPERTALRVSFWTIAVAAFLAFWSVSFLPALLIPSIVKGMIALLYGAVLYILLGLSRLAFTDRALLYRVVHSGILFFVMAEFFLYAPSLGNASFFPLFFWFGGMALLLTLLMKEAFGFLEAGRPRTVRLLSFAFALLALEVSALALFLPLGFISAGAFLALFLIMLRDTFLAHFEGNLGFSFILKQLTFFAVFSSILFATAPWFLP